MTTWVFLLLLAALLAGAVLWPVWSGHRASPVGRGIESLDDAEKWEAEQHRLASEQRLLDLSLVEGRIDKAGYEEERARLARCAEEVLRRLRAARRVSLAGNGLHRPRVAGASLAVAIIAGAFAFTAHLGARNTFETPSANKPATEGDKPDVAAMVGRLEARIKDGDPTLEDLSMLARSYFVLGRLEESARLYTRVLEKEPENVPALMALGQIRFDSKDDTKRAEAERYFDKVLALKPDFPEALWYKSLGLLKQHRVGEAKEILTRLAPLVGNDARAETAVKELMAHLELVAPAVRKEQPQAGGKSDVN